MSFGKVILVFIVVFILCFWGISAIYGFPLFGGDTICFLPTSYYLGSLDHLLINKLYHPTQSADSSFLFYPPLFPVAIFLFNKLADSVNQTHISLFILQSVGFLLALRLIYNLVKDFRSEVVKSKILIYLFYVVVIFSLAAAFTSGNSRPESLCKLYLVIALFSFTLRISNILYILQGVLITMSIFTSPVFGFYLVLFQLGFLLNKKLITLKTIIYVSIGFLLAVLIFLILYPYKLSELLKNMNIHAANVVLNRQDSYTFKDFVHYHIFSPIISFGFLLFIYAVGIIYFLMLKANRNLRNKIQILFISFFVFVITFLTFRRLPMAYYLYVLSPFLIIVIMKQAFYSKPFFIASFLVLSLFSFSLIRNIYVTADSIKKGAISINVFSTKIDELIKDKNASVSFSPSLWPALVKYPNTQVAGDLSKCSSDYIILQQVYSGLSMPPKIEGYSIVENEFENKELSFLGIKVASQVHGYQFAMYKKILSE
jgi:hypothetical protein